MNSNNLQTQPEQNTENVKNLKELLSLLDDIKTVLDAKDRTSKRLLRRIVDEMQSIIINNL